MTGCRLRKQKRESPRRTSATHRTARPDPSAVLAESPSTSTLLLLVEHGQSAVDQIGRARDVFAVGCGQEYSQTGDVVRLAQASQRNLTDQRLQLDRVVQELRVDGCLDRARRDAVDRDAEWSELDRERARQHPDSALARAVRREVGEC